MRLADKVILITGSTTGIGEAFARRCVAEGARVLLHGRDKARGEKLAGELGNKASLYFDDLADPAAPERIVAAAIKAFDRLDGVINNAALIGRSDMTDTTVELWDRFMAVNVRAPFLIIKAARPYLEASHGAVLNIGSVNAYCGQINLLPYSVSKGALQTLSKNLADYFGGKLRVNHFNVGWVLTDNEYRYKLQDGFPADWPSKVGPPGSPMRRLIKPEEIAAAAVYWLSDESIAISGSVLELEQYPFVGRNAIKPPE
jgi:NAD(P)-dependent dehydrogenase (short-subunit alcohol dehydrogenase family)